MSFKDPAQCLDDILENIGRIERHTEGMDSEAFLNDEKTIDAVERNLLRISEAAQRLGNQADTLCPGMPWASIRGMGNRLRHGYDNVDLNIIWEVVEKDLLPLKASVAEALAHFPVPEPPAQRKQLAPDPATDKPE